MTNRSLKSGIHLIGNIIKDIYEGNDDALEQEPDILRGGKITKVLSKFIITPNVIVDNNLKYMDQKDFANLVKTEMNLFTGILTQAIRVMVEIYAVNPTIVIDKFNNSTLIDDISRIKDLVSGKESFDYIGDLLLNENTVPGIEAGSNLINNSYINKDVSGFVNAYELQVSMLTKNGDKALLTIPIVVFPNIMYNKTETLLNNMVSSDSGKTFFDVFNDYRAGLKSFSDLIFATSLVKEYRNKKMSNDNDFAAYLNKVDKISTFKDLLHNRNSFSKNFNIYIFDSSFTPTINKLVKGNILKDKYKNMLTNMLMAFSVTLVDVEQEEVTILIDEIPGFSVLNYKMLAKEKDSDIAKVVKELMKNKQPF